MNTQLRSLRASPLLVAAAALLAMTSPSLAQSPDKPADKPAAAVPASVWLAKPPEKASEARTITEAKKAVKKGDKVLLRGRIGGSRDPFVANRAMFTMADLSLAACSDRPDDSCKTPWDYCCEPADELVAGVATVQFVGEKNLPIRTTLTGQHGIEPLSVILVSGTVAQCDNKSVLIVHADGVYVERFGDARFVAEPLAGAVSVKQAVKETADGQTVTLRGRIGGSATPFTTGQSVFSIIDAEVKPSGDGAGRWDASNLSADERSAATATVEVRGWNKKPLTESVEGLSGLKTGAIVSIQGKASVVGGKLTIIASRLCVEDK